MHVACCMQAEDSQVYDYLEPLARHPRVERVWIVRSCAARYAPVRGASWVLTPAATRPGRWARMRHACEALAARPEVRAFVSFNPFPYGLIGARAASRHGKAWHLGFIGSDWYRDARGPLGALLLPMARRADFLTATGEGMRAEMVARGLDPARIAVLPHCIDLARHPVADPAEAEVDFLYVGKLVRRKRVEDLLRALARLRGDHPEARLLVVGDGPERASLEGLRARLGLEAAVEFLGFQVDPAPIYRRARAVLISSSEEGLPFALVEGLASGLVPLASRVGTIADCFTDEVDALLFAPGDVAGLATRMGRLIEDGALRARLREGALRLRPRFDFARATEVWDAFLRRVQ